MAKKKDKIWIQKASADIKKRGTEGVCTGPKFGGPTCPEGSKRYNLAKVFKGMAKKKKKAAWGSMIHAKDSKYIRYKDDALGGTPDRPGRHPPVKYSSEKKQVKKKKKWTLEEKIKIMTGPIPREFLHNRRILHSDPRMLRQGGILKAKTSAFAETHAANWAKRRGAATTGMKVAGAGTAYKSTGWVNKNLNKLKDMMKLGSKTTSMGVGLSKYTSKIPKASQLKTLAKAGGRRSLALAGGPIGLGMYAGTSLAKAAVTSAFKGYKKDGKWTKEGMKRLESQARSREALMAKRNKARNAKTGTMVRAAQGIEVLGKQQVPFKIEPASANLAEQRQGRKGAAVTGFDFKGVR